jgi:hypothetical protein
VERSTDLLQEALDRDWLLISKADDLQARAHVVARRIEKRIRRLLRSYSEAAARAKGSDQLHGQPG